MAPWKGDMAAETRTGAPLASLAWCVSTVAPAFGSPALLQPCGSIATACADGRLRCFAEDGAPQWTLACGAAGGALFCTPTPLGASQLLLGTSCGRLLAVEWEGTAGWLGWELPLGCGRVVASIGIDASPPPPQWAGWRMVLVAAANPGEAILIAAPEGRGGGKPRAPRVLARLPFPADLFSAPVLCCGRAVLGCRDDHVYSMELRWPAQGPSVGADGSTS